MLMKSAPHIVLYGRHSTKLVDYLGGTVVGTFLDPDVSRHRRNRPGLKQLLRLIEYGEADMVVYESLTRDAEDLVWLGDVDWALKNPAGWAGLCVCLGLRLCGENARPKLVVLADVLRWLREGDTTEADTQFMALFNRKIVFINIL